MDDERGLALFVVGDNLRKGAALNAVQIAEAAGPALTDVDPGPVSSDATNLVVTHCAMANDTAQTIGTTTNIHALNRFSISVTSTTTVISPVPRKLVGCCRRSARP